MSSRALPSKVPGHGKGAADLQLLLELLGSRQGGLAGLSSCGLLAWKPSLGTSGRSAVMLSWVLVPHRVHRHRLPGEGLGAHSLLLLFVGVANDTHLLFLLGRSVLCGAGVAARHLDEIAHI